MDKRNELELDLQQVDRRLYAIEIEKEELAAEKDALLRHKIKVETELDSYYYSKKGIKVTEHAILRFLERKIGVNIDSVLEEIVTDNLAGTVGIVESGLIPLGEGFAARVVNKTVVTIIKK